MLEEFLSSPTLPLPCEEGPVSLEAAKFDAVLKAGEASQGKGEEKKQAHLKPMKRRSKKKAFYRITLIDQPKGSETDGWKLKDK